ncbi:hypothetical protein TNIN_210121 [Trichonephila inaurata madagascariensis]|uniref:Uncharacterized protein n=1 Tax=Trichonephila inaurata madagascariensis TaxID=2747483 RepID=A0A8X6XN49_9ARAC|nr:hypothetical protein TNIN_210121 [Trichonephila inaurata madagascariensis]
MFLTSNFLVSDARQIRRVQILLLAFRLQHHSDTLEWKRNNPPSKMQKLDDCDFWCIRTAGDTSYNMQRTCSNEYCALPQQVQQVLMVAVQIKQALIRLVASL